jgi:RimJ/RimL family protein N-acetyltransferase
MGKAMTGWWMEEAPSPAAVERRFTARDGRIVRLRPAQAEDAGPLLAALNDVAAEGRYLLTRHWDITPELQARWLHTAIDSRDLLLVATVAAAEDAPAEIAGSVSLVRRQHEFVRHTAELGMWLQAAYREIGIGSAMVEAALAWATAQEIEKVTLSVRSNNRRALSLYQKYGFVEEGRRRGYIKTPQGYEDECLLSYSAAPPSSGLEHASLDPDLEAADADE